MPPAHDFVTANGLRHHLVSEGTGPLVLCVHGWPEGARSWRHQLPALAAAGYRAVAPDVRGYGQTDAPADVSAYRMKEHVADCVGILDALGEQQAVVVGHDWGAGIAWNCALMHPDRFRAVAALSVPLTPRPPAPPMSIFRSRFASAFFYMLYFQEPGVAEAELEKDVRRTLRLVFHAASGEGSPVPGFFGPAPRGAMLDAMSEPSAPSAWLTEEELDGYVEDFARSGFRGPLNRYRNMDRDWEELAPWASEKVQVPALFVAGDRDLVLQVGGGDPIARMRERVPDLREALLLPGAGHWIQQERPSETNAALLRFLGGLGGG